MAAADTSVLFLGSFTAVEGFPGWVVHVTSPHGREWLIAVLIDEVARTQKIRYIETVPWAEWAGTSNGTNRLRDGEVPKRAAFERMKARAPKNALNG